MLRVKVTLVYMVFVGLLVGLTVLIVQMNVTDIVRSDTEASLQRAASAAERTALLDEAVLLGSAQYMGSSDRLHRSLLGEFVREKAGEVAAGEEGEEGAEGAAPSAEGADFAGERHLDANEKLTAQSYRLEELAKSEEGGVLTVAPSELDAIFVLDAQGIGVAALGKDLYSWFGADIAKQFPSVREVADGGAARVEYWDWSFKPADEKRLYRMAIAPVRRSETETPAGVVILGTMVNDGIAKKKQQMISGGTAEEVPEAHVATEFAYFRGGAVVASTFGSDKQRALNDALKAKGFMDETAPQEVEVAGKPYLASSRLIRGGDKPVGVVVLSSLEDARAPLAALRVNILLLGGVILLVGGLLIFFFIVRYMKPIEDLETGIQEVIAGNTDYVWQPDPSHDLQNSFATHLNLLSAYLQGKPMPDDDVAPGGWGDLMGGDATKKSGPSKVQGVDLGALSAPPRPAEDKES